MQIECVFYPFVRVNTKNRRGQCLPQRHTLTFVHDVSSESRPSVWGEHTAVHESLTDKWRRQCSEPAPA